MSQSRGVQKRGESLRKGVSQERGRKHQKRGPRKGGEASQRDGPGGGGKPQKGTSSQSTRPERFDIAATNKKISRIFLCYFLPIITY